MTAPALESVERHVHYPLRVQTCDLCSVHFYSSPLGLLVDAWLQRTDRLIRNVAPAGRSRRRKHSARKDGRR
jgi:hypothetical protein